MATLANRPAGSTPAVPLLVRLYPADWRDRYGDEFAELLASRPPRLRDRLDILVGAIDARLHPQVGRGAPSEAPMPRDRSAGGLIVVAGALLTTWAVLGVLFMGRWDGPEEAATRTLLSVSYVSGLLGAVLIAIALLLVASRYQSSIGSAGAVGGVLTGSGLVFSALGGGVAALLLLGGGTVLLAWRVRGRLVGTLPAVTLTSATLLVVGAFLGVAASGWTDPTPFRLVLLYGPAWAIVGLHRRAPARQFVGA
jgi:hypothetical protein